MSNILTNGSKIGNAKVISNEVNKAGAAVPGRKLATIGYITMHQTGVIDVKANNFHRSLKRENGTNGGRQASWHFSVDDIEIYQEVDMSWETWHAGNSTGNKNSISIEMCMWNDKEKQRKTYDNAARLVAQLMKQYKIPLNKVVQHNHWSGKDCPQFLRSNKHGYNWNWFIDLVKKYYNGETSTPAPPPSSNTQFKVGDKVTVSKNATKYATGQTMASFVKGSSYTIKELKSDRALLSDISSWVYLKDLSKSGSATAPTFKEYKVKVTADSLNVRSGPSTDYKVTTSIKKNEVYTIIGEKSGWGQLKSGAGWISLKYTQKV